jgi:hypothetical protein
MKTRKLGATALLSVLMLATLPTVGCSGVSPAQIQADGQAVYQTLVNLAAVESLSNPVLAAQLTTAAKGLLAVTNGWQTGSALQDFNTAANLVEVALSAIPQTQAIAPFIPIIIGGLDLIIANIPGATKVPATLTAQHNYALMVYKAQGAALLPPHRWYHSNDAESRFKKAWNDTVKAHPGVGVVEIK